MELLSLDRSIVVVIDLQGKLMEMIHRPNLVVKSTLRLLELADVFEVPVLQLLGEGGPHLYLIPTSTTDGERAVEAVFGEPKTVLEVVQSMVEYR